MATPSYLSASQAAGSGGLLGRLGSYFGGGTPAYVGDGQPSSIASGGLLRGDATPAYKLAPVAATPETPVYEAAEDAAPMVSADEVEAMTCPIDPEALAEGRIAIVIPRRGS